MIISSYSFCHMGDVSDCDISEIPASNRMRISGEQDY